MAKDHVATLRQARERLVEDRRNLAASLTTPYTREAAEAIERNQRRLVEVQKAIAAVDAAITDEQAIDAAGGAGGAS